MDSFIVYTSFYKPISRLTDAQLGRLFRAIFLYKMGEEPKISDDIRMAFDFFQTQLDIDADKYQRKVQQNKLNGRLGGIARSRKLKQTPDSVANATAVANAKNCSLYDNDNDNENNNDVLNINYMAINSHVSSSKADDAIRSSTQEKKKETEQAIMIRDYYNEQIASNKARLACCTSFTDRRKSAIMARIREYGAEKVKACIDKAVASHFLNYGATNAPVNIDWLMRPNNFPKVLEGSYDNKTNPDFGRNDIDNSTDKFDKWKKGWKSAQ